MCEFNLTQKSGVDNVAYVFTSLYFFSTLLVMKRHLNIKTMYLVDIWEWIQEKVHVFFYVIYIFVMFDKARPKWAPVSGHIAISVPLFSVKHWVSSQYAENVILLEH